MEALSTYNTIQEIAEVAVKSYDKNLGADPDEYAKNVIELYCSESALNPIRDNPYHKHLLEAYPGTVRNEILRKLNRYQKLCNKNQNDV